MRLIPMFLWAACCHFAIKSKHPGAGAAVDTHFSPSFSSPHHNSSRRSTENNAFMLSVRLLLGWKSGECVLRQCHAAGMSQRNIWMAISSMCRGHITTTAGSATASSAPASTGSAATDRGRSRPCSAKCGMGPACTGEWSPWCLLQIASASCIYQEHTMTRAGSATAFSPPAALGQQRFFHSRRSGIGLACTRAQLA